MTDPEPSIRNDAVAWSDWDADEYKRINYDQVLPEDAEIIEYASKFLVDACGEPSRFKRAVDVGAGPNLYPSLLMLPWAEHIVFTEYAPSNIRWLTKNLTQASGEWPWQPFWNLVADLPCYRTIHDPRRKLADVHEVRELSIFDLPPLTWDLGSMFFVADGITSDREEFESGVSTFLGALVPGSPFLMAFMEGSRFYEVRDVKFPSMQVTPDSLSALLARLPVAHTRILRTDKTIRQVRPGYDAMLFVTGFIAT